VNEIIDKATVKHYCFTRMEEATASIRDLRLNFRAVQRQIEKNGKVVITNNGVPSYVIQPISPNPVKDVEPIDYWARLSRQKSKPLTPEQTKSLHEENRGNR
jgi:hypothetical protein